VLPKRLSVHALACEARGGSTLGSQTACRVALVKCVTHIPYVLWVLCPCVDSQGLAGQCLLRAAGVLQQTHLHRRAWQRATVSSSKDSMYGSSISKESTHGRHNKHQQAHCVPFWNACHSLACLLLRKRLLYWHTCSHVHTKEPGCKITITHYHKSTPQGQRTRGPSCSDPGGSSVSSSCSSESS
jgi:hypothetical protein